MALIYENNIPDIDRDSISLLRGGLQISRMKRLL